MPGRRPTSPGASPKAIPSWRRSAASNATSRVRCTRSSRSGTGRSTRLALSLDTQKGVLESLIWLETFLKGYQGALLMTSHDRAFMNRIVSKIVEIDGGDITTYSGDYEFYERQRALFEQQAEAQYERQQAMLAKEMRFIERFKAQAAKAAQVQSRVKKLDKIDKLEAPKRRRNITFDFPTP